jgi:acetamidase/formamidase
MVAKSWEGTRFMLSVPTLSTTFGTTISTVLEVTSGEVVEFSLRDASDEQIQANSTADDVAMLDFDHVNPVSGPVYIQGAQPGGVLAVEILEFRSREWGWTAFIPGFGLLADEFPEPWLRISSVEAERGRVVFADGIELPYEPFPGTTGVAPAEPGPHSIVPPSRWEATWTSNISESARPSTCRLA